MLDCLMDWNKYGTRTIHLRALSHTYDLTQLKHSITDPPLTLNSNMAFMFREARTFLTEPWISLGLPRMKSNLNSNQLRSYQISFSLQGEPVLHSSVQILCYCWPIFRNIEWKKISSGVGDPIYLNRSWLFKAERCWLLHKNGLNNRVASFSGKKKWLPVELSIVLIIGHHFSACSPSSDLPCFQVFLEHQASLWDLLWFFIDTVPIFFISRDPTLRVNIASPMPYMFISLFDSLIFVRNLPTCLCSWLGLHWPRYIALPEMK